MTNPLRTEIREHHGAPTLFINGRPDTGLMLYHNNVERGHDEMADFARAGIDLITTGVGSTGSLREDGSLDTSDIDARMKLILAANPRALVLTRLWLGPPDWWVKGNPDQMMVHYDPHLGKEVESEYRCVSFASAKWRAEMGQGMQRIIRYCEERYSEHFLGYHICAGECGEWSYAWRHYTQSDYSVAQQDTFREWCSRRREEAESAAQPDDRLLTSAATIPRDWRRAADASPWLDPQQDALLVKYMEFHSQVVADAILHFARLAKEQLRALGREKIVAVFYGYHFTPPGNPSAFFNAGHHALAKVLASPDVDVFCAPYSYHHREAGGTYYSQLVAGSARLHGKLYYSEEDTVTHVVPPHPYRYHCPDRWTTENVLLRNVLGSLRDGGTSWYMDWFGQNWYRDDELMKSIAATQRLAQQRLNWNNASVAEVAVLVSEKTVTRLRHDGELINRWTLEQMAELWRIGAPLDAFLLSDLPRLDRHRYRLLVFLDAEEVPDVQTGGCVALRTDGSRTLSADELRRAALDAGVHIYSDAGDQVLAEESLLVVHAASDGERIVRLPRPRTVTEAFSGAMIATGADHFTLRLRLGETAVLKLT